MGDAIIYCNGCETRQFCHMSRKCMNKPRKETLPPISDRMLLILGEGVLLKKKRNAQIIAKEISEYLTTGMHYNTPEGQVAIARIIEKGL